MLIELHAGTLAVLTLLAALAGALLAGMVLTLRRDRARRARRAQRLATPDSVARFDSVTGLPSRATFDKQLDAALAAPDPARRRGAVIYLGLDGFRSVNDRHGHQFGDDLLSQVGQRLRERLGTTVPMCRVASDEFACWFEGSAGDADAFARELAAQLQRPFTVRDQTLSIGASVGIALHPEHGGRSRIVTRAAAAMRAVKLQGGHAHAVFNPAVAAAEREELELARDLEGAIERHELVLYYQPKIDAATLKVTAAEALLRWTHPQWGIVTPEQFIPLAERHGLIGDIGDWVLDEALRQAAAWRKQGLHMRVAVNVSGYQMRHEEFAARLEKGLRFHGLKARRFTCEITETVAMEDTAVTQRTFERLGALGVHVSIDDFGTGHSSLASLRKLPAEELKIDRAFVIDLEESAEARTIVQAIVQMAHTLGLRIVAEGVETEGQRDILVSMGVEELQGYLFAMPMTARALGLWAMDSATTLAQAFKPSLFADGLSVLMDEMPARSMRRG